MGLPGFVSAAAVFSSFKAFPSPTRVMQSMPQAGMDGESV